MIGARVIDCGDGDLCVHYVLPGGPAAEAGLRQGDRILSSPPFRLADTWQFGRLVRSHTAGSIIPLVLLRDGDSLRVDCPVTAIRDLFSLMAETGGSSAGDVRLRRTALNARQDTLESTLRDLIQRLDAVDEVEVIESEIAAVLELYGDDCRLDDVRFALDHPLEVAQLAEDIAEAFRQVQTAGEILVAGASHLDLALAPPPRRLTPPADFVSETTGGAVGGLLVETAYAAGIEVSRAFDSLSTEDRRSLFAAAPSLLDAFAENVALEGSSGRLWEQHVETIRLAKRVRLERLVAATTTTPARPGLRNPDELVVGPVDFEERLGRWRGPDHQQQQDDPDHMAGDRGAKRPANPLALHPEERNIVGPTVRIDRQPVSRTDLGNRAAGAPDHATAGPGATRRPLRGRAALPPAPFRWRVGLVSRWKRNLTEAQAVHAMRSLQALSLSATVIHSRVQSRYRDAARLAHTARAHITIMAPGTYVMPTAVTLIARPSSPAATPGGTAARIFRRRGRALGRPVAEGRRQSAADASRQNRRCCLGCLRGFSVASRRPTPSSRLAEAGRHVSRDGSRCDADISPRTARRAPPRRRWRRCRHHTQTSPPARQRRAARCVPPPSRRLARSAFHR
ncbi:MAG: PDZ domain-containing protein [Acidobacteria bacterium]|nr:PDZ domain-containing protein [Acidobacteriota bacterium]